MATEKVSRIEIPQPRIIEAHVTLVGVTPLMTCRPSPTDLPGSGKGKGERGAGAITKSKYASPEDQYLASRYIVDGKDMFPAPAVKAAMLSAIGMLQSAGITKLGQKRAKPMFTICALDGTDMMLLRFAKCTHDQRVGRNKQGNLITVNRACYHHWETDVAVRFDEDLLRLETIMAILARAGQVGIGAYRRECGGSFGEFNVATCEPPTA